MSDFALQPILQGVAVSSSRQSSQTRMQTVSFKSPTLAGGFFTTWEAGSIPGPGRSRGIGNGNTLQYSCLQNPMDRGDWQASVHGVTKSRIQLSDSICV